jgi:plastocyanin
MKVTILLFSLLFVSSGYFINESFAEISENQAFLLEGSGFAVTEESIKISDIDFGLSSHQQRGSTIDFLIEDGFITLDNEEFIVSELEGKFLREGRYIRINGNIESSNGLDTTISFFGRLVEESKDAAVYGFTGKITTTDDTYKIIFTTKLSTLSKTISNSQNIEESDLIIHILKNSSAQETTDDTIPGLDAAQHLRFFSEDRISIEPGTTIIFVNDDDTSHRLVSGTGNSNILNGKICSEIIDDIPEGFSYIPEGSEGRDCDFIFDGRINTGEIASGDSITITFDDRGFYRLLDPDYPWMRIDGYVFSNLNDNIVFGEGQNLGN